MATGPTSWPGQTLPFEQRNVLCGRAAARRERQSARKLSAQNTGRPGKQPEDTADGCSGKAPRSAAHILPEHPTWPRSAGSSRAMSPRRVDCSHARLRSPRTSYPPGNPQTPRIAESPPSPTAEAASYPRPGKQSAPPLPAPSGAARSPAASSQTALRVHSPWLPPWQGEQELPDASDRPKQRRQHQDSA